MDYEYDIERIVYFAATDSRNRQIPFGIRAKDRMRHMYVIGKTGMGKSTLLENMAIQDIQNGEGMAFIDPHGSTAEKLLEYVPENRIDDVLYFAPFDTEYPIGFNVMEDVGYDKRHLVVAGLMSSFQRIWVDAWSARMEYILQNTLLALLEYPDTTLIDVNRMLVNKEFRNKVVEYISDPIVKRFWVEEFAGYTDRYTQEATPAIQNKIGQFTANPLVRNIVGQAQSSFDIRKLMDERKIFIVNLSKGRMGEQNADLLGSILTTKMYLSAMSRAEETPQALAKLPPFYLYVDEFQSVVNDSFANILSEARKYKLALTIAHQYIEQVEEHIRAAVFGNVGTTITFRVGPFDAEVLKTIFEPTFYAEDLVNLGFAQIYLTLMIDGIGSKPFSAKTLPPVDDPPFSFTKDIIERSREKYARARAKVEETIRGVDTNIPPGGFDTPSQAKKKRQQEAKQGGKPQQGGSDRPQQSNRPAPQNSATRQENQKQNGQSGGSKQGGNQHSPGGSPKQKQQKGSGGQQQQQGKKQEDKEHKGGDGELAKASRDDLRAALSALSAGQQSASKSEQKQQEPAVQNTQQPHTKKESAPKPASSRQPEDETTKQTKHEQHAPPVDATNEEYRSEPRENPKTTQDNPRTQPQERTQKKTSPGVSNELLRKILQTPDDNDDTP